MTDPRRRTLPAILATFALAAGLLVAAPASAQTPAFVSDDFSQEQLDEDLWSVVDPVGDGVVSSAGPSGERRLSLAVPAGSNHDPWHVNRSVRVVQATADDDFVAEVGFGSVPAEKYQIQGLLVEQGADDWLRFDFHSTGSELKVFAASTVAGSSSAKLSSTIDAAPGSALFMRVSRGGDVWLMEYSYDGVAWESAGSFTHSLTVSALGPFVGNAGASPAFDAVVDYVANVPLRQVDVSVSGSGSGSVDVSPGGPTYVEGTEVTLTAVADPGSVFVGWSGDVVSADPSVVVTLSSDLVVDAVFDTAAVDVTPPEISGVTVSAVTASSATVSWTTDEPATSVVSYGPTVAYEDGSLRDTTLTTSHSATLTGLVAESTYHLAVESVDAAGNTTTGPDTTFTTGPAGAVFVGDDFEGLMLSPVWSVVDPVGDGSVGVDGVGSLVLSVPAGVKHDAWATNRSVRVVQATADDDFVAEVGFGSVPAEKYQIQGLLVEQGADDWLRFDFHSTGSELKVFAASTVAGSSSAKLSSTIDAAPGSALFMRVSRGGDVWLMEYSYDGVAWESAGSFTHSLTVSALGPFVGNAGASPAFDAVVDYVANVPLRQVDVSVSGSGSGSVDVSPGGPTYVEGTEVTLTAVADPGSVFVGWSGDVVSADPSVVVTLSSDLVVDAVFDTAAVDVTPPEISGVTVSAVTASSATVSWTTDEPATSVVSYGPTVAYEDGSLRDTTLTTSHSATLTGLVAESTYHLAVESVDAAGNTTTGPDTTFTTGPAGAVFVGDDFEGLMLSPVWSVVDPVGDGSVGVDGVGSLVLSVPAGVKHDAWATNRSVRVVQATADDDFVAEVGFGSVPAEKYQIQGLLVEQGADDWLRFDFHSTGSELKVFAASTVAGSSSAKLSSTIDAAPGSALFMRVSRGGDVWLMEYSYDGVAWESAGSFTHSLTVSALGPFVGNAGASPAFDAVVDYVANVPLRQVDVSVSGSGSGSVDVSPGGPTYVEGTEVTLTAVADPGSVFVGWSGDVVSADPSVVVTLSSDLVVDAVFDTAAVDVTPPEISGVTVSAVTASSATVSWTTDEPATSVVSYGPTVAYEDGSLRDTTLTTSHSATLTGLVAESTYHLAVESVDAAGNTTTGPDTTFTTGPAGAVFVGDDFEGLMLSPVWSVVDPVGDGSVGVDGVGSLVLSVPAGVKHDAWATNRSVRVVQATADDDFVAEVGFGSVPAEKYQIQGLLVEQGADDWLRFDFHSTGSELKVFAASTVAGSSSAKLSSTIDAAPGSALFMRVSRGGDVWLMEYSYDGVAWESAGSFTHSLTVSALGPFVGNAGASPAFDAVVDYVANVPLRQVDVSVSGSGSGSVDVSPGGPTYVEGTEVTLTAVADPGSVFVGWSGDVVSADPSVVVTLSSDLVVDAVFDTAAVDVTPPEISGVTVSAVTASSATVSWTTDEPATSVVSYGPTVAYEDGSLRDTTLTTSHSATLTGLVAESTYHLAVESVDAAGNTTTGPDTTFTTGPAGPGGPVIDLWYGEHQTFGERGRSQGWVNVLGNVADPDGVASLSYTVNGGSSQSLSMGPDAIRLDEPGDFNVEIDRTSLPVGLSTVVISAVDDAGDSSSVTVTVELLENAVSIPFSVDWSSEPSILNPAQVVDGDWVIDGSDVRLAGAAALGYDRLLAVGDQTWTDYEVWVPVRFEGHGDQWGTPQSGLPLFGLGLRWQGHSESGSTRPRKGIYPVGAYTWFRWDSTLTSGRYQLSGNDNSPLIRADGTVVAGDELLIKARVETIAGGTQYSVKYWDPAHSEPAEWLLEIVEDDGPATGALALFTHHSDVRFGTISVNPL